MHHRHWLAYRMAPASMISAAEAANESNNFLSLPAGWLHLLIASHLDRESRLAVMQTSRTLCHLVLSAAPASRPQVNVRGNGSRALCVWGGCGVWVWVGPRACVRA
jgi:hypothetical protein